MLSSQDWALASQPQRAATSGLLQVCQPTGQDDFQLQHLFLTQQIRRSKQLFSVCTVFGLVLLTTNTSFFPPVALFLLCMFVWVSGLFLQFPLTNSGKGSARKFMNPNIQGHKQAAGEESNLNANM